MEYQKDYLRRVKHEGFEIIDSFYGPSRNPPPPPYPPGHDPYTEAGLRWNLAPSRSISVTQGPFKTSLDLNPMETQGQNWRKSSPDIYSKKAWNHGFLLKSHESKPQVCEAAGVTLMNRNEAAKLHGGKSL
ncbi:hypothetical protein SLE2022_141100 [Rubroshorea leprosula]